MPIYAYKCESCGHRQDVLQKISDPLLTVCPSCGAAAFSKQVTAAGFQLKGSGWYVTDFRNGSAAAAKPADAATDKPAADTSAAPVPASASPAPASAAAPAPAPAPAPKTGTSTPSSSGG